jgi:hypothetical protein
LSGIPFGRKETFFPTKVSIKRKREKMYKNAQEL